MATHMAAIAALGGHPSRGTATPTATVAVSAASKTPAVGTARACATFRGELARHRVITADGLDFVVATADGSRRGQGYTTSAYPVANGYLVMLRQPLCALPSADEAEAWAQHDQLVRVLAELGTGVVRARRRSAAWRKAERMVEPESLAATLADA